MNATLSFPYGASGTLCQWPHETRTLQNDPESIHIGTERGCVVLDQPQHAASSRRLRTSHALRLVFDTAALRSNGPGRVIRGQLWRGSPSCRFLSDPPAGKLEVIRVNFKASAFHSVSQAGNDFSSRTE